MGPDYTLPISWLRIKENSIMYKTAQEVFEMGFQDHLEKVGLAIPTIKKGIIQAAKSKGKTVANEALKGVTKKKRGALGRIIDRLKGHKKGKVVGGKGSRVRLQRTAKERLSEIAPGELGSTKKLTRKRPATGGMMDRMPGNTDWKRREYQVLLKDYSRGKDDKRTVRHALRYMKDIMKDAGTK